MTMTCNKTFFEASEINNDKWNFSQTHKSLERTLILIGQRKTCATFLKVNKIDINKQGR